MILFNIVILILTFSHNGFCGNSCGKGQAHVKEIEEIKEYYAPEKKITDAQKKGLLEIKIKEIIKAKADINGKYYLFSRYSNKKENGRLLEFAVDFFDVKNVKLLLKNDANPDINFTLLHYKNSNCNLLKYLYMVPHLYEDVEYRKTIYRLIAYQSYFNELKKEFKVIDILLPPLKNLILEYLYEIE